MPLFNPFAVLKDDVDVCKVCNEKIRANATEMHGYTVHKTCKGYAQAMGPSHKDKGDGTL